MAFNFSTSVLPTSDNTFSLGSASKRWKINDQEITFDTIYPVGAVYISVVECNPEQLFGGEWEQITGRFLLACDTTYTNGSTGGSTTMTHTHTMAHTHTMSHTHSQVATTSGGPSNNTSGGNNNATAGPNTANTGGNNGATAGPSNNTSGSTAISIAQLPKHAHDGLHWSSATGNCLTLTTGGSVSGHLISYTWRTDLAYPNNIVTGYEGSGSGHTHTLSSHTHTMSSHTHTLSSHTHTMSSHTHTLSSHTHSTSATTTGGASNATTSAASNATTSAASNDNNMPPYLAVYMYKRIA